MSGALLLAGPPPWMEPRRPGLPISAHIARPDPFDEEQVFTDWAREAGEVALELHRYNSRRWCDMTSCGNRAKLRNYRERRR